MKSYFRTEIAGMEGYVPGEQPKLENLCKLNTNENAFPPSPAVKRAIAELDWERLRRYPDPLAEARRDKIAEVFGLKRENVIAGNGSDDILTMVFRCFTSPELPMACLYPTYSLYPELAKMQGAAVIPVPLAPRTFELPGDLLKRVEKANLLIITRPNAPTGNSFPLETMRELCRNFDGVVLFDEAYADVADVFEELCAGRAAARVCGRLPGADRRDVQGEGLLQPRPDDAGAGACGIQRPRLSEGVQRKDQNDPEGFHRAA